MDTVQSSKTTVMSFEAAADTWEAVGSKGFSDGHPVTYTSLSVYNGIPYVAYREHTQDAFFNDYYKITVMSFEAGSGAWVPVGSPGFSAGDVNYTTINVYQGIPYVAYMDVANGNKTTVMKYNEAANTWEVVGIAGFSDGGADYVSLFISEGIPYVAYMDEINGFKATVMKYGP